MYNTDKVKITVSLIWSVPDVQLIAGNPRFRPQFFQVRAGTGNAAVHEYEEHHFETVRWTVQGHLSGDL